MMFRLIVAFLAIGLGFWAIFQGSEPDSAPQSLPSLPVIDQAQVTQVDMIPRSGQQASIHLLVVAEAWVLKGEKNTPANVDAVVRLIRDLTSMQPIRLLSNKPELYEKFHLDDRATRVVLKNQNDQVLLDVLIGKQGTDLISTYIKIADEPAALAVNKTLLWQIRRVPKSWQADDEQQPVIDNNE